MNAVLVGYGEVGKGLYDVLKDYHHIEIYDPGLGFNCEGIKENKDFTCDILLIAIPYSEFFENAVKIHKEIFKPQITVVFSTVPIGTCKRIGAYHSPIEGRHDRMGYYIKKHMRFVGGERSDKLTAFFYSAKLLVYWLPDSDFTEFLKLRSLAIYGVEIEMARYSGKIANDLGLDYNEIKEYDRYYNDLNASMDVPIQRPILDPPKGKIGGHCVLQNMKLLNGQHYHPIIQSVLNINNMLIVESYLKEYFPWNNTTVYQAGDKVLFKGKEIIIRQPGYQTEQELQRILDEKETPIKNKKLYFGMGCQHFTGQWDRTEMEIEDYKTKCEPDLVFLQS